MDVRTHRITLPNPDPKTGKHEVTFYDWGDVDAAHAVFCVHGLTRNGRDFTFLAEELARRGRRVLAPDMAGRGQSAWLADPMDYGYGTYMADCLAIMDNFHMRKVDWVGTSMGGIIGMMIAAMHPKRIRKLVLNDVGSFIPKEALQRIFTYISSTPQSFPSREAASQYLKQIYGSFNIPAGPMWEAFVDASLVPPKDGVYRLACDPGIMAPVKRDTNNFTEVNDADLRALWDEIEHPTFIIHGAISDVLTGETIRLMKAANPHTESVDIPNTGHAPALIDAGQVAMVANWLAPMAPKVAL